MRFLKRVILVSFVRCIWAVSLLGLSALSAPVSADTIVVLGDSLSSGYGLPLEQSWVSRLEGRLKAEGYGYTVVNASIAGDTSSGGLARLPSLLATHRPSIVIVELGGNDGLRGQPVQNLRANLERIIELTREHGAAPVLAGIQIPPNYGPAYAGAFANLYPTLARDLDVPLVGFLMEDVALNADLMQADGIHPNARGNEVLLENVWDVLAALL
jgi:acyl-CoA thioesterase-1